VRGEVRPPAGQPFPPRHDLSPLADGQVARGLPLRSVGDDAGLRAGEGVCNWWMRAELPARLRSLRGGRGAADEAISPAIPSTAPARVGFCHRERAQRAKQSHPAICVHSALGKDSGRDWFGPLGPRNDTSYNSRARSFHLGFIVSINTTFRSLPPALICFSREIALTGLS